MAVKKGLGKGLDSLITDKVNTKPAASKNNPTPKSEHAADAIMMNITKVEPNREQPRKKFDEDALLELAESIKQYGVLQPLLVQEREDYYEIVAGERRWRAAKIAGIKEIPVIIKKLTRQEIMEISLIENIQREDLNPIEEAAAYESLIQKLGYTQEKLAERVGKSREYCANIMRLLKLPEDVQSMVVNKQLTMSHVRPLLSLNDEEEIYEAAEKIKKNKMSVREVEAYVRDVNGGGQKKPKKKEKDPMIRDLEIQLSEKLGTQVVFSKKSFTISYHDTDDLNRILELIGCLDESIHQS